MDEFNFAGKNLPKNMLDHDHRFIFYAKHLYLLLIKRLVLKRPSLIDKVFILSWFTVRIWTKKPIDFFDLTLPFSASKKSNLKPTFYIRIRYYRNIFSFSIFYQFLINIFLTLFSLKTFIQDKGNILQIIEQQLLSIV